MCFYFFPLFFKVTLLTNQSFQNSRSHGRATAQKISDFAQNIEICMRELKIYAF
jgi:hypothetical protein